MVVMTEGAIPLNVHQRQSIARRYSYHVYELLDSVDDAHDAP